MKLIASTLLAAAVLMTAGIARAEDTAKKVGNGAEETGKTVVHGTTAVGKGASKIFHDTARGVHKVIAKNTKNPHKKAVHLRKAQIQHEEAVEKTHQSKKELDKAGNSADKVVK